MKLTPWFPPEVKPVRVGLYNASLRKDKRFYRFWDGRHWSLKVYEGQLPQFVEYRMNTIDRSVYKNFIYWRGLAKPPK